MSEMILKVKSYSTNYRSSVNIVDNNDIKRRILNTLLFVLGSFALFYVFILGNMVVNIVERRTLESNARAISSEVSSLELTYLKLSEEVDLEMSYTMGFAKTTKPSFATRKPVTALKFANNEI